MMKKQTRNIILFIVVGLISCFACVGCGDVSQDEIASISVISSEDDPYEMTFNQVGDVVDDYIKIKHPIASKITYKRGTERYINELTKIKNREEIESLPESPAINVYCEMYSAANIAGVDAMVLDEDGIPMELSQKTIYEYAKEMGVDVTEL